MIFHKFKVLLSIKSQTFEKMKFLNFTDCVKHFFSCLKLNIEKFFLNSQNLLKVFKYFYKTRENFDLTPTKMKKILKIYKKFTLKKIKLHGIPETHYNENPLKIIKTRYKCARGSYVRPFRSVGLPI